MDQNIAGEIRLLQASIKGSSDDFERLVTKYQSLVCAITYSATGDIEKSEELAQETFVRAWKNLTQLRDQTRFKFWLCSIAKSTIKNHFRHRKSDIIHKAGQITDANSISSSAPDPAQNLIAKEQQAVVDQALQALPESYRQPLILFYRKEQSTTQVADLLDLTEDNVRTRLSRGRKMLKQQVTKMIENSLSSTAPGKAFTVAVMASVAGIAIKGTVAAAAVGATVAASNTAAGAAVTTGSVLLASAAAKVAAAIVIVAIAVGSTVAIHSFNKNDTTAEPAALGQLSAPAADENDVSNMVRQPSITKQDAQSNTEINTDELQGNDPLIAAANSIENSGEKSLLLKTPESNNINAALAGKTTLPTQPPATPDNQKQGVLGLKVIAKETGQPIEEIDVKATIYDMNGKKFKSDGKTDHSGRYDVTLQENMSVLTISVNAPSRVPIKMSYRDERGNVKTPLNYTLALEKGTSIGGVINNENGQPIKEAQVKLLVPGEDYGIERPSIWDYTVKTDGDGKWQCDIIPSDLKDVGIRLAHSDYISDTSYGATGKPSMEQLRDMTGIMVMKQGLGVVGIVTDHEGKPIDKARVVQGSDRWGSHYPSTRTNEKGEFAFINAKPGEMILTVSAKGKAPQLRAVDVRSDLGFVEFSLKPGNTIKGRLVDTDGKPVQGAFVAADTWRGHRSISWRADTNKEGRFQWDQAPSDEVLFDLGKQGYMSLRDAALIASDEEYELVINRPLEMSGKVVDAKTGKPIKSFTLFQGTKSSDDANIWWNDRSAKKYSDGKYTRVFREPRYAYALKVKAEGYLPVISRVFKPEEEKVEIDFKLEKGEGLSGIVYLPDGSTAEGVEVVTSTRGISIKDGELLPNEQPYCLTDSEGRFKFDPVFDDYVIVAKNSQGWACIFSTESPDSLDMILEPWARVQGVVFVGAEIGSGEKISANRNVPHRQPNVHIYSISTADKNGKYSFDYLPAGKLQISREIKLAANRTTYADTERIEIKPGQTVELNLGGKGRPVKGRLVVAAGSEGIIDFKTGWTSISTKMDFDPEKKLTPPKPTYPEGFAALSRSEQAEWFQKWYKSDELKEYIEMTKPLIEAEQLQRKNYPVIIHQDGTFEIEGVVEGNYQLRGNFSKPSNDEFGFGGGKRTGSVEFEFTVGKIEGGLSTEPLDLGNILAEARKELKVGDAAPDFEFKDIDGKIRKISDYRGKFVLIDFWHRQGRDDARPGHEEMGRLYKQFGSQDQFVIISVTSGDSTPPELMKQYIDHFNMKWIVATFKDDQTRNSTMKQYVTNGYPARFLLGMDAELLGANLKEKELTNTLKTIFE